MPPKPPRLPLPALLGLTTRVVTEAVHNGLAAAGFADIRPAHGYAFSLIAVREGATGVEIAAHLGMTKQSVKVMIDQLEAAGYVTRERIERDRRARVVQLTDRAWACIEVGTRLWAAAEADLEALLGTAALETTRHTLEQLVRSHIGPEDVVPLRPPR
ncbi:MAG: MarR family transcriptional regulator [Actinomycetota bacterium]|nr:MarR family transcriptional regulator [Actinomycetota bacterium]MDQ3717389.1 MarR family transcriptional regulator [Actinomycetota bacterium]